MTNERGFALVQVTLLALMLAVGLAALYRYAGTLGASAVTYDAVDSIETANRSAANTAAELIEQVVLDNVVPAGAVVADADLATHDLFPSNQAAWDDEAETDPDLVIAQGPITSRVDIDYVPLASGFSWTSIKFGNAYQEAAAGNAAAGALTYRIRVVTTRGAGQRLTSEAVYIVNR